LTTSQPRLSSSSSSDAVVAGLRARGAELVGELERYENSYRLCYVRGPEGIIIELAEQIG
jgi:catechol 2,3-dioxygenase-like lactoylglutathione lyase family enzyme